MMKLHGKETLFVIIVCLLMFGSSFVYSAQKKEIEITTPEIVQTETTITPIITQKEIDTFSKKNISANAVYVYDLKNNQVIYQKNAEVVMPLASLTKIMTALVTYQKISPDSLISIKKGETEEDGDIQLKDKELWRMKDLLDYTMTISSNDGAVSLAAAVNFNNTNQNIIGNRDEFIESLNTTAKKLNLQNTVFYNESGLDQDEVTPGANGTAKDMANLFGHVLLNYPEILEATRAPAFSINSLNETVHLAINTNPIISKIPSIIGSKTGYTPLAGGNLVVAYDAGINHPVIAVVMGSTYFGRFDDMLEIIEATNEYFTLQNKQ